VSELPGGRRVALALAAVAVSSVLLHRQVADALVVRGDEFLYRARAKAALCYYRRALWLDRSSSPALDRLLFVAMTIRDRAALRDGIARAKSYLLANPGDDTVRLDRAMAYKLLGESARAWKDFAVAGYRLRDPRALTLGGYEAKAAGLDVQALRLLRSALVLAPEFPPALHALTRVRTLQ